MKIVAAVVISLAFSCLLPFSQGKVDRYKMSIVEKGTRFSEEIEVDEKRDVEVFRVPSHNDVDAADYYHDFKMGVTVTRVMSRKACYIAKMDPSMPSPKKLNENLAKAASQAGELPTTIEKNLVVVIGPANILSLTSEILDFCGDLPIYETEVYNNLIEDKNETITVRTARRQRRQIFLTNFTNCLATDGHSPLTYIIQGGCIDNTHWDITCQIKRRARTCLYFVNCVNTKTPTPGNNDVWKCTSSHIYQATSYCCDYVCPPGTGK